MLFCSHPKSLLIIFGLALRFLSALSARSAAGYLRIFGLGWLDRLGLLLRARAN